MSLENASQFLQAVARDQVLRDRFTPLQSSEEFLDIAHQLGYSFTIAQLKQVASDHSQNHKLRRSTGVWRWLRQMQWFSN
jgi:predicted ribosomally synthesized peptide with nif11-like leader